MNTENLVILHTNVHNQRCIGCKRHNKDIMVTMVVPDTPERSDMAFHDYFLTSNQARELLKELVQRLEENKETEE